MSGRILAMDSVSVARELMRILAQAYLGGGSYRGNMRPPNLRTRSSLAIRLAAGAVVAGATCIVAGLFIAYLIADHSSSDGSPSSLTAIGLGVLGVLLVLVSAVLFIGQWPGTASALGPQAASRRAGQQVNPQVADLAGGIHKCQLATNEPRSQPAQGTPSSRQMRASSTLPGHEFLCTLSAWRS